MPKSADILGNLPERRYKKFPEGRYLYIFLHIPRCAGTTISHAINKRYPENILNLPIKGTGFSSGKEDIFVDKQWIENYISQIPAQRRQSISFIKGHTTYIGIHKFFNKQFRYFTFLRHPIDLVVSHYNHFLKRSKTKPDIARCANIIKPDGEVIEFAVYFKKTFYLHNLMTKILSLAYIGQVAPDRWWTSTVDENDLHNAMLALKQCWFVGLVEEQSSFEWIAKRLNLDVSEKRNISEKYIIPNNEQRQLILDYNRFDAQLYDHARVLHLRTIT